MRNLSYSSRIKNTTIPATLLEKIVFLRLDFEPIQLKDTLMAVTELKRKARRNRAIATNKVNAIKQLLRKPTIKNVDIEAIKASFADKKATK